MFIQNTTLPLPYDLDERFADCEALVAALEARWRCSEDANGE